MRTPSKTPQPGGVVQQSGGGNSLWLRPGVRVQTPDGPGSYVGFADYEYVRLAGSGRRFSWIYAGSAVDGPHIIKLDREVYGARIRGYVYDQLRPEVAR